MAEALSPEYQTRKYSTAIPVASCDEKATLRRSVISAFSIAVEYACTQLQTERGSQPHLPVREYAGGDRETVGPVEVCRDAPHSEDTGEEGCGRQQSGYSKRETLVLA